MQELANENSALREINLKFQLENYNLQKRIRQLESLQNNHIPPSFATHDQEVSDEEIEEIIFQDESDEDTTKKEVYEVITADTETEEYLEEFQVESAKIEEPEIKKRRTQVDLIIEDTSEEVTEESSKQAMSTLLEMAARSGVYDKIKSISNERAKDSAFVSKALEILFDKVTLASSSAQGQKCQSNLAREAKPALDPKKLDLCRRAFIYRLYQEPGTFENRLKVFYKLVNHKIQNTRKCLNRHDSTRLQEC